MAQAAAADSKPDSDDDAHRAPAVSIRNLKMGYGTRVLLEDASFDLARGEILVILGGSGCGKSSLMKNIIGLYQPMGGRRADRGKQHCQRDPAG